MKQVYVFTRKKNEHFPDAVQIGHLFLAPILESKTIAFLDYCENNGITHAELSADEIINDTDTQVIIATYEDAKEVCKNFIPEIIEE